MNCIIMLFNILIVPFCGFFIYRKKAGKSFSIFDILGFYSLFCTLTLITARLPVFLLRIFGIQVLLWSILYSAVAFFCAMVISALFIIFTDYIHIGFYIEKK